MAILLDGKVVARQIRETVSAEVAQMAQNNKHVKLAIVMASQDPSSQSYIDSIIKAADKVGIKTLVEKPSEINQTNLEMIVANLGQDTSIDGILLQTPMPDSIDIGNLSELIPPSKDIDGQNPLSAGRLASRIKSFSPATAQAVLEIFRFYKIDLTGKNVVVVGRSNVVGKPLIQLLLSANATVTTCHTKTKNLSQHIKMADILVSAAGQSNLIGPDLVHEYLTVIDVGTNFDESGKMTGDVDFTAVEPLVKEITPVPGGVGPVTTAVLLKHACSAAKKEL